MPLSKEIEAYENLRSELEMDHFGAWVVFHDGRLIGKFPSIEAAVENAIQQFGRDPYLIRRIGQAPLTLPVSLKSRFAPFGDRKSIQKHHCKV